MSSEEQIEELESLGYIYASNPVHIQVRISSELESGGSPIKALLDLTWGEKYPHEKPTILIISMDISADDKELIMSNLLDSCDNCLGMAMTYVLSTTFSQLLSDLHENRLIRVKAAVDNTPKEEVNESTANSGSVVSSEKLPQTQENKTKAQKRHEQNNWGKAGELPRGYNWVDVISHLRKTADS